MLHWFFSSSSSSSSSSSFLRKKSSILSASLILELRNDPREDNLIGLLRKFHSIGCFHYSLILELRNDIRENNLIGCSGNFTVLDVIKAFGWMIPAVAVSFLLGTDNPNAFLMALAVPLGQTALSLVLDKVWGTTSTNPKRRSRTKTRKKPFARASSKTKKTEPKAGEYKTSEGKGSYQSWVATDGGSTKKNTSRAPSFGGWDDLDKASYKASGRRSQKGDERPKQNEGKLSRRRRVRDRPLLLRLLIAVFPFLDSWSKFLS